jgi:hypothetical protein
MGDNSPGSASPLHFMHDMMVNLLLNVALAGSRCAYVGTLIQNLYSALTRTQIKKFPCAVTGTLLFTAIKSETYAGFSSYGLRLAAVVPVIH